MGKGATIYDDIMVLSIFTEKTSSANSEMATSGGSIASRHLGM